MWGEPHQGLLGVHPASSTDARRFHGQPVRQGVHDLDDGVLDGFRTARRRRAHQMAQDLTVLVHDAGGNLRSPDVDSDTEHCFPTFLCVVHSLIARPEPLGRRFR